MKTRAAGVEAGWKAYTGCQRFHFGRQVGDVAARFVGLRLFHGQSSRSVTKYMSIQCSLGGMPSCERPREDAPRYSFAWVASPRHHWLTCMCQGMYVRSCTVWAQCDRYKNCSIEQSRPSSISDAAGCSSAKTQAPATPYTSQKSQLRDMTSLSMLWRALERASSNAHRASAS
jgi:hypothetical protein